MSYTQVKATLDELSGRSEGNRKKLLRAKALIAEVRADTNAMATNYTDLISEINTAAAANPNNNAWQLALAEKNQMVTDFQAVRDDAIALDIAVGNSVE